MPAADGLDRRARGAQVEAAARQHLIDAGLRALAGNVNYRVGELDLVMLDRDRDGDVVVFVEVRYRAGDDFGGGAASVDHGKRRKLLRAAQLFLLKSPLLKGPLARTQRAVEPNCRFDVIEASGDPAAPRLHWIRDAFRADD
ncbi:MAG: YraN family protein [Pseudomonadota bacterium]|nr:YraN family protein [Pseudomonadota bacterium]